MKKKELRPQQYSACSKLLLAAIVILFTACENISKPVQIDILYQSAQCMDMDAGLHHLTELSQLTRITDSNNSGAKKQFSDTLFNESYVVLLSEGRRMTAGYSLALDANEVLPVMDLLQLPVTAKNPGNAIVAQMLTHPCLILAIEKGGYHQIEVLEFSLDL